MHLLHFSLTLTFQGTNKPHLDPVQIAVVLRNLMLRLGFEKFYMQAGDWGSQCATHLATLFPENVLGYVPISLLIFYLSYYSCFGWKSISNSLDMITAYSLIIFVIYFCLAINLWVVAYLIILFVCMTSDVTDINFCLLNYNLIWKWNTSSIIIITNVIYRSTFVINI